MAADFHTHTVHPGKRELVSSPVPLECRWSLESHPWKQLPLPSPEEAAGADALGELGYDRFSPVPPEIQLERFGELMQLAADLHKPVVLHWVGPVQYIYQAMRKHRNVKLLFHGFSRHNPVLLAELLRMGLAVSLAPALTGDEQIREFLKKNPGCRVGLESDDRPEAVIEELYERLAIPGFEAGADELFEEFLNHG